MCREKETSVWEEGMRQPHKQHAANLIGDGTDRGEEMTPGDGELSEQVSDGSAQSAGQVATDAAANFNRKSNSGSTGGPTKLSPSDS